MYNHFGNQFGSYSEKNEIVPCYSSPEYVSKRIPTIPQGHSTMFIATLLIIARNQKQPKCHSVEKWIKKKKI